MKTIRDQFEAQAADWFGEDITRYRWGDSYKHQKVAAAWRWYQAGIESARIVRELAAGGKV